MKRLVLTITIVLGIVLGASAQNGGLFGKGPSRGYDNEYYDDYNSRDGMLNLPGSHGESTDQPLPIGNGALLLIGFGAAYLVGKNRRKA